MKLNPKEFSEYKKLCSAAKANKLNDAGKARLAELDAKKNERGSNDLAWWKNYPEVLDSVARIPFNHIAGEAYDFISPDGVNLPSYVPGVARVRYLPTIGRSSSHSDAFNSQVRQLWLDMHRKYRGIGSYQASDLGIAIFCIINLFSVFSKFTRMYAVVNTYKIQNRNVPFTLVNALNISNDIMNRMADFRAGLNYRISKLQQLCLPKGLAAVQNEMILNSFVFKDSDNPRSSLFMYDPKYFYIYEPTLLSTGGAAFADVFEDYMNDSTPGGFAAFDVDDAFQVLDTMMNALLVDDDIAKMCSDLVAAYGPENVMNLPYIPENLTCEPVHDYERKLQFHNATLVPNVASYFDKNGLSTADIQNIQQYKTPGIAIFQKNDVIINGLSAYYYPSASWQLDGQRYTLAGTTAYGTGIGGPVGQTALLDTFVDQPGEMEIVCGTRLTTLTSGQKSFTVGGTTYYYTILEAYGLEVVLDCELFTKDKSSVLSSSVVKQVLNDNATESDVVNNVRLNQFDWCPILYYHVIGDDFRILSDIDNATVVTVALLKPLHDVAIYSAFKIPNVTYIN